MKLGWSGNSYFKKIATFAADRRKEEPSCTSPLMHRKRHHRRGAGPVGGLQIEEEREEREGRFGIEVRIVDEEPRAAIEDLHRR